MHYRNHMLNRWKGGGIMTEQSTNLLSYPASIKDLTQWVGYMLVDNPDKPKPDKIPVNPRTLSGAMSNNPATWSDYKTARECVGKQATVYQKRKAGNEKITGNVSGIGIMFANRLCGMATIKRNQHSCSHDHNWRKSITARFYPIMANLSH